MVSIVDWLMLFCPRHFARPPMTRICTAMNKVLTIALGGLFAAGVLFSQIANAASECEAKALVKEVLSLLKVK